MILEFSGQIFEKYSNIKFHENPLSGNRVVHASRRKEWRTDMAKLIAVFCDFANVPKMVESQWNCRNRF